ncbi:MAG TPA: GH92 family glycosyl hydrolase [Bacteroidales bacterium]|nr:GH92 family glycosyl hydrolase [Bacteroidales bacterium]
MYKDLKHSPFTVLIVLMVAGIFGSGCVSKKFVDYVNPFVGTDEHGHTFPGASLPAGMVQLSPDTDIHGWDWCSGYHYSDSSIMGFSHLHRSGMGAGDWGDILIMPTTGKLKVEPGSKYNPDEGYRSRFTHEEEEASPGYYAVNLKDYGIKAELTVTERAGFHKYTFPKSDVSHILVDLEHGIWDRCTGSQVKIVNNTEIEGYRTSTGFVKNQTVYFCAQFSKPFNSYGTWKEKKIKSGSMEESGTQIGAFVDYVTSGDETIEVKVGISYTGIAQARLNLNKEIPHWEFDRIKEQARKIWNKELSKIEVQMNIDNDEAYRKKNIVKFYTALYHSLLFPATFSDADGKYMGLDNKVHIAKDFTYSSDFSLWDTFRAEMPLLALVQPERNNDAIRTMIAQYEQGGWLPTPQQFGNSYTNDMIGDHPVAVILDAYMKGIKDFDVEKAYEAVKKNAMETPPSEHRSRGRVGLDYYKEYGYLPSDKVSQSVSRTLEYAYNDWCVAQLAKILGKMDDYEMFMKRASYYKNIFDPSTGFARPKNSKGSWVEPFDPTFICYGNERHYTEANAWQYTWFVPHDVQGLINLEGGTEKFNKKLDSLFTINSEIPGKKVNDVTGLIGQYAQGNEPSHHTIYLYDYSGVPWKTQDLVRKVMNNLYNAGPAGLCGNEDMGQMSAWFIFSAMGFYPIAPGQNVYSIGSPIFNKVTIHLDKPYYNADKFVIEARDNSKENKYIQSAMLNGKPLNEPWFNHSAIKNGGTLIFQMGPEPNKEWGNAQNAAPPSMTKEIRMP